VQQSRATVDPGSERSDAFQVAADQQWDYHGYARSPTPKYDRAMYSLSAPTDVRRGRHWQEHPEEIAATRGGDSGRLIRRRDGSMELDHAADGGSLGVSAVHSGGDGLDNGEQVGNDSAGCSVVHGAWFPHFNESLRRASGGDHVRFTYSLIDPRMFAQ